MWKVIDLQSKQIIPVVLLTASIFAGTLQAQTREGSTHYGDPFYINTLNQIPRISTAPPANDTKALQQLENPNALNSVGELLTSSVSMPYSRIENPSPGMEANYANTMESIKEENNAEKLAMPHAGSGPIKLLSSETTTNNYNEAMVQKGTNYMATLGMTEPVLGLSLTNAVAMANATTTNTMLSPAFMNTMLTSMPGTKEFIMSSLNSCIAAKATDGNWVEAYQKCTGDMHAGTDFAAKDHPLELAAKDASNIIKVSEKLYPVPEAVPGNYDDHVIAYFSAIRNSFVNDWFGDYLITIPPADAVSTGNITTSRTIKLTKVPPQKTMALHEVEIRMDLFKDMLMVLRTYCNEGSNPGFWVQYGGGTYTDRLDFYDGGNAQVIDPIRRLSVAGVPFSRLVGEGMFRMFSSFFKSASVEINCGMLDDAAVFTALRYRGNTRFKDYYLKLFRYVDLVAKIQIFAIGISTEQYIKDRLAGVDRQAELQKAAFDLVYSAYNMDPAKSNLKDMQTALTADLKDYIATLGVEVNNEVGNRGLNLATTAGARARAKADAGASGPG